MIRIFLLTILAVFLTASASGCKAKECRQMQSCCDALQERDDHDDIRGACNLGDDTRDPTTCRDVTRTIGYLLEEREQPIPESCNL